MSDEKLPSKSGNLGLGGLLGSLSTKEYGITRVHYAKTGWKHIESAMVFLPDGGTFRSEIKASRREIIDAIRRGDTYTTYPPDGLPGAKVRVIDMEGVQYLTTESNKEKRDNLDQLPEF